MGLEGALLIGGLVGGWFVRWMEPCVEARGMGVAQARAVEAGANDLWGALVLRARGGFGRLSVTRSRSAAAVQAQLLP